jgi:cytochrome c peroxidase
MIQSLETGMLKRIAILSVLSLAGWQFHAAGAVPEVSVKRFGRDDYRRPVDIPYPADNPYSTAKFELGKSLFFDPILSGAGDISCGSCHSPALSWADGRPRAIGAAGKPLAFRAPTLLNVAWQSPLGWDGKFASLEAVTFGPITGKANMNSSEESVLARLEASPEYPRLFPAAFAGGEVSRTHIEEAIATYERSIVSGAAPFDRWVGGDDGAIDAAAKRGFELFNGRAGCAECHAGWAFTDGAFHDIGVAQGEDIGRGRYFAGSVKLRYAFKTPTLRDVAKRGPYMHDGSVPTLEKVIDLYDGGGVKRPSRSDLIKPLALSAPEKADLVAFLRTLSSD